MLESERKRKRKLELENRILQGFKFRFSQNMSVSQQFPAKVLVSKKLQDITYMQKMHEWMSKWTFIHVNLYTKRKYQRETHLNMVWEAG